MRRRYLVTLDFHHNPKFQAFRVLIEDGDFWRDTGSIVGSPEFVMAEIDSRLKHWAELRGWGEVQWELV